MTDEEKELEKLKKEYKEKFGIDVEDDPDYIEYTKNLDHTLRRVSLIEKQIREERHKETLMVDQMTEEELDEYIWSCYQEVNKFAEENGLTTKELAPKKKGKKHD